MDSILFSIGGQPVSLAWALIGGLGLVGLALLVLIVVVLRADGQRTDEAAKTATNNLRDSFDQQLADRDNRIGDLEAELSQTRQDNTNLQANTAALNSKMEVEKLQSEQNLQRFQNARQQMTDEFKLIANETLKSHGETFSKQNREQVDTLLKPLSDKIIEFQKEAVEGRTQISEHLRRLAEDSVNMRSEAQNLTRALKGNSQMQGAWGEMILSSVLERSGLIEGEHYEVQQSYTGEDGRVRTDVEIILPNDKGKMIVDSKVSLTAFEAYTNSEDEAERHTQLRAHIQSLRNHVKVLGSKEYHRQSGSEFDFVIMFVPIEGAFSAALHADSSLIDYAFSMGVSISTPTTLLSALRTISNIWDIDKRNKNAEVIAERAGALYDKVSGFLGSMDKLDKSLGTAQKSFDDAKSQLVSGRGSVVRQVEMLRDLGAKSSKQLPSSWDEEDASEPSLLPHDGAENDASTGG